MSHVLDLKNGDHGDEESSLVVRKDGMEDGVDVELVDAEAANKPFQSLSCWLHEEVG